MKKSFTLAILLMALVATANAQDKVMQVHMNNGSVTEFDTKNIEQVTFVDSDWQTLGWGQYTEGVLSDFYCIETEGDLVCTYDVEIQESVEQPGLYRIVNPYKDYTYKWVFEFYQNGSYDDTQDYFLVIDATDPTRVWLPWNQDTGMDIGVPSGSGVGQGELYIGSTVAYYVEERHESWEDQDARGYYGKLEDGVITFPTDGVIAQWSVGLYFANQYDTFKIVLPNQLMGSPAKKQTQQIDPSSVVGLKATSQARRVE